MSPRTHAIVATSLSAAGVAFSGYLSAVRLQSGMCALDEACPFFLGYPACYFGFGLFAALLVVSLTALVTRTQSAWAAVADAVIAAAGVLFAARMTAVDLAAGGRHPMILPTCAWGLVFFVAMLAVSLPAAIARRRPRHVAA